MDSDNSQAKLGHNPTLVLPTLECPNQVKAPQVDEGDEQALATHHTSEKALGPSASSSKTQFTPIVPWILKFTGSNHNITGNMDGEDGFFDHTQELSNMFFGDGDNYISYQPI
ncbi:unspecified product [Plasmodium ovale curtisi]|uniref:Unspecified product n=1 Tax=Plasmodium ovale curtisi TaxID=864141 RepID=A0A1A8XD37_PLAOA|nr:unspecified product [Plasmodium ovale curtisi]SBT01765.1 unspecified product [Plasmodium ovale curtisi]